MRSRFFGPAALALLIAACEGGGARVDVGIEPREALVARAASLRFEATVTGSFDRSIEWSVVQGAGTIDSSGRYTAPAEIPPDEENDIRVRAISPVDGSFAEASVRIVLPPFAPLSGPSSGGTRVTFTGITLDGATPQVSFGADPATAVEVVSGNTFHAWTPARFPDAGPTLGAVTVTVTLPDRTLEFPQGFRYAATHIRFPTPFAASTCDAPSDVLIDDLEGDGLFELIAGCAVFTIEIRSADAWNGLGEPVRHLLPAGMSTFALAAGDVDGDGVKEVAALQRAEGGTASFALYRYVAETSGITLLQEVPLPATVSNIDDVLLADMDGDGRSEVFFTDFAADSLGFLANDAGTLGVPEVTSGFVGAVQLAAGDVDGQNGLDLVATTTTGFALILNDGTGAGGPVSFQPTAPAVVNVDVNDFDGDGNLDVVTGGVLCEPACLQYSRGDGGGGFEPSVAIPLEYEVGFRTMASGDIDGDGRGDLAILDETNDLLQVYAGYPALGLIPVTAVGAASVRPLGMGPLLDGKTTLVLSYPSTRSFLIAPNAATAAIPQFSVGAFRVLPHPVHADGVVAIYTSTGGTIGGLASIRFDETGVVFDYETRPLQDDLPRDFAIADVDGDGRPDVVTVVGTEQILLFRGMPGGGFDEPELLASAGSELNAVEAGDLDGDGRPDLLVSDVDLANPETGGSLLFLRAQAGGSFVDPVALPVGVFPVFGELVDLEDDGSEELVVVDLLGGAVRVFPVLPGGDLGAPFEITTPDLPIRARTIDLDGDGRKDLVVQNLTTLTEGVVDVVVRSYRNLGDLQLALQGELLVEGVQGFHFDVADFDADGVLDLATTHHAPLGLGFAIARGRGDCTFFPPERHFPLLGVGAFAAIEANDDGLPDVAAYGAGVIHAYVNRSR